MSSPYDRYGGRRRGVWSHWVPLVLTVTAATAGVAAWIWRQRDGDEDVDEDVDEDAYLYRGFDYEKADYGENPPYGASNRGRHGDGAAGVERRTEMSRGPEPTAGAAGRAGTWGAQVSGVLRRTPSPQKFFDSARKTVTAGVTAASVAVGSALASIREEDKTAYADHETWSEEADARKGVGREASSAAGAAPAAGSRKKRKAVALVVSAKSHGGHVDAGGFLEHASILSHIPRLSDFSAVKIYVLIYAPGLTDASLDATNKPAPAPAPAPASLSSSFSNIEQGEEKSPPLMASATEPAFNAVYAEAMGLVEKESMVLPFTTPNGYAYILRHLQPDVIYLQASLGGDNGAVVTQMQSWLRHDLVLVVGAEGGHGGLADSESETERPAKEEKWWLREDRVGRGRGVVVVDGMRVQDDWVRRVQGKE